MHRAVGAALTDWTYIELQLHQIFAVCMSLTAMQPGGGFSADHRIQHAVLDAIDGFRGKLCMIDAALQVALEGLDEDAASILRDWVGLRKKVNALHRNRNALAHWSVCRWANQDGSTLRVVLAPQPYETNQHQGVAETDVGEWGRAFRSTGQRIGVFVERLASHRGLQIRHLANVTGQVRCTLPSDSTLLDFLKRELSDQL